MFPVSWYQKCAPGYLGGFCRGDKQLTVAVPTKTALVSGSLDKMVKCRGRILVILSFDGW